MVRGACFQVKRSRLERMRKLLRADEMRLMEKIHYWACRIYCDSQQDAIVLA